MSYIYPTVKGSSTQYKVYFIFEGKKIYLGLFSSYETAELALQEANKIMLAPRGTLEFTNLLIDYKKIICLCNFRDHKVYIKNPIYLYQTYFLYYVSKEIILTFDTKDLLYFSTYKIFKRGNYLYTQDSISQQNILSRFGIPNHSVMGKDYEFINGNIYDFRRSNLKVINNYKGVSQKIKGDQILYVASIYTSSTIIIGNYHSEIEAAIAYNKAIDLLKAQSITKEFTYNDIPFITKQEYDVVYNSITISPRITQPQHTRKKVFGINPYRGVSAIKSGYRANISYQSKQIYLGVYPTEKRAAQAYNFASFYLFGKQGYINEVSPLIHDADADKIAKYLSKHIKK